MTQIRTLTLAASLALPDLAHAGAWTLPAGSGQIIVTGLTSNSVIGYDATGATTAIAPYLKHDVFVLGEFGLSDDLTMIANPSYDAVNVTGGTNNSGAGYTEVGARLRLAHPSDGVLSLQSKVLIPGEQRGDRLAQLNSQGTQVDLRALAGHDFHVGRLPVFVDGEAGYRWRGGAARRMNSTSTPRWACTPPVG